MNTTSISLLERLRQPAETDAWKRFADLYTPLLYYWARRLGLQESDAADLVQEVFLLLIHKLPEFTHNRTGSFRSWLRTVLLNQWHTLQRRRVPVPADGAGHGVEEMTIGDDVAAFGEREYQAYLAHRALQVMQKDFQPSTWRACWEQVVNGRSAGDVAAELGISEGAAYVAKSRVLRRLRQELAGLHE
jgi:RNA polymerase sigma-70 factor (ECF subfamily)